MVHERRKMSAVITVIILEKSVESCDDNAALVKL